MSTTVGTKTSMNATIAQLRIKARELEREIRKLEERFRTEAPGNDYKWQREVMGVKTRTEQDAIEQLNYVLAVKSANVEAMMKVRQANEAIRAIDSVLYDLTGTDWDDEAIKAK